MLTISLRCSIDLYLTCTHTNHKLRTDLHNGMSRKLSPCTSHSHCLRNRFDPRRQFEWPSAFWPTWQSCLFHPSKVWRSQLHRTQRSISRTFLHSTGSFPHRSLVRLWLGLSFEHSRKSSNYYRVCTEIWPCSCSAVVRLDFPRCPHFHCLRHTRRQRDHNLLRTSSRGLLFLASSSVLA